MLLIYYICWVFFRMEDVYQGPYTIFFITFVFRMEDVYQGLYAIILLHLFLEWKMWTRDCMLLLSPRQRSCEGI